jgi:hypothetical protein
MTVKGNGGTLTTFTKAHVRNYGDVWFHPSAITNVLSLKNVREQFKVTFNSDTTNSFVVHKPTGGTLKFEMHQDGLYYHDPKQHQMSLVNTVEDEQERYSKTQAAQPKAGTESSDYYTFTVADVNRAEIIHGPGVPTLEGETTRLFPELNVTSANEHVPQIEKRTRVIEDRVRSIRDSTPFKFIPTLMLVELFYFSTMWINAFPPKGSISNHVSPRGIMTGTQFGYAKNSKLPTGINVRAHEEPHPTNTQAETHDDYETHEDYNPGTLTPVHILVDFPAIPPPPPPPVIDEIAGATRITDEIAGATRPQRVRIISSRLIPSMMGYNISVYRRHKNPRSDTNPRSATTRENSP